MDVIQVNNLYKNFGKEEVLKGINLTVKKGEIVTIIGSSGSGKSTLLRCLNYLEIPTKGEILFHGKNYFTSERLLSCVISAPVARHRP